MSLELVLLSGAFVTIAGCCCWMAIQMKRAVQRWWSELLNGIAIDMR